MCRHVGRGGEREDHKSARRSSLALQPCSTHYPDPQKPSKTTWVQVEGHQKSVTMLLIANSYEQDDLVGCRRHLDKGGDDPDMLVNTGCVLFKEGHYEEARKRFNEALSAIGWVRCVRGGEGVGEERGGGCSSQNKGTWTYGPITFLSCAPPDAGTSPSCSTTLRSASTRQSSTEMR
jgi:hypothetical protein